MSQPDVCLGWIQNIAEYLAVVEREKNFNNFLNFRRKEKTKFQNGFQHGHSTSSQHQVFHGGSIFQHDTAAGRDAEDPADKKGKKIFLF